MFKSKLAHALYKQIQMASPTFEQNPYKGGWTNFTGKNYIGYN